MPAVGFQIAATGRRKRDARDDPADRQVDGFRSSPVAQNLSTLSVKQQLLEDPRTRKIGWLNRALLFQSVHNVEV